MALAGSVSPGLYPRVQDLDPACRLMVRETGPVAWIRRYILFHRKRSPHRLREQR